MEQRKPDKTPLRPGPLEERKETSRPGDVVRTVRARLLEGRTKEAYALLLKAVAQHPDDPLLLSYCGYLQALVDKKFHSGITACTRAILLLKKNASFSEEAVYPVFYLNLGRACIAAGKKKDAIIAFKKGLKYDAGNSELRAELLDLGTRKKPPLPFLDRANPINRTIGKIFRKTRKKPR